MPSCVRCVLQVSRTAEGSRPYLCNQFKLFGRWYKITSQKVRSAGQVEAPSASLPILPSRARTLVRRPCWRKFATSVCSDATPVASTYEGFRTGEDACPSTLLAQVRYVVSCVAMRRQSRRRMKGSEEARALVRRPCWRKIATSCCV
jgi:hypothetical protein